MRVVFIGTGEIGVPTLRWLLTAKEHEVVAVVTQPDKPAGRDQRIQAPPIKTALAGSSIPILQPDRIKRAGAVEEIHAQEPDVIVVMAYGQILPATILTIPRIACLNLHASLLPRHRGAAPIQAAITSGDAETGITVMYMDEGLDTGDILSQSRITIAPDETGGSLHDRLAEIAPMALAAGLAQLESGSAPRVPQDNAEATYAPKLEREHGQIDWSQAAQVIERQVRAFNPWPGAYTVLRDDAGRERKLKIFSSTVLDEFQPGPAGLIASETRGLLVGASQGALRLQEVQLEGKKRMNSAAFVRGHPWLATATVVQATRRSERAS
jgi:methionyl-tRNA formyltransferase